MAPTADGSMRPATRCRWAGREPQSARPLSLGAPRRDCATLTSSAPPRLTARLAQEQSISRKDCSWTWREEIDIHRPITEARQLGLPATVTDAPRQQLADQVRISTLLDQLQQRHSLVGHRRCLRFGSRLRNPNLYRRPAMAASGHWPSAALRQRLRARPPTPRAGTQPRSGQSGRHCRRVDRPKASLVQPFPLDRARVRVRAGEGR